jgi:hypothetical protein
MDQAGRNKILPRRRGRKPEEGKFKNRLGEENGSKKTACSNRQDQDIYRTPLGPGLVSLLYIERMATAVDKPE